MPSAVSVSRAPSVVAACIFRTASRCVRASNARRQPERRIGNASFSVTLRCDGEGPHGCNQPASFNLHDLGRLRHASGRVAQRDFAPARTRVDFWPAGHRAAYADSGMRLASLGRSRWSSRKASRSTIDPRVPSSLSNRCVRSLISVPSPNHDRQSWSDRRARKLLLVKRPQSGCNDHVLPLFIDHTAAA